MHTNVLWQWQTRGKNNNVPSSDCVRSHIYLHAVMLGKDQTCSERAGGREEVIKRRNKSTTESIRNMESLLRTLSPWALSDSLLLHETSTNTVRCCLMTDRTVSASRRVQNCIKYFSEYLTYDNWTLLLQVLFWERWTVHNPAAENVLRYILALNHSELHKLHSGILKSILWQTGSRCKDLNCIDVIHRAGRSEASAVRLTFHTELWRQRYSSRTTEGGDNL